jgi:hypothetical protein
MPELKDLEARLAVLRKQVALGIAGGYTSLQILQLQRDFQLLWAQLEMQRRRQLASLLPTSANQESAGDGASAPRTR